MQNLMVLRYSHRWSAFFITASDSERQWRNLGLCGGVTGSSNDTLWLSIGRGSEIRLNPYLKSVFWYWGLHSDRGLWRFETGVMSSEDKNRFFLPWAAWLVSSTTGWEGNRMVRYPLLVKHNLPTHSVAYFQNSRNGPLAFTCIMFLNITWYKNYQQDWLQGGGGKSHRPSTNRGPTTKD